MSASIRALTPADRDSALHVINTAARWYREFLPDEELHDPEMTPEGWNSESERMTWYGAFDDDRLIGVAALEYVENAALLRHAYILPEHQRHGIGSLLTQELEALIEGVDRIIVGTYRDNYKARGLLVKLGYRQCADSERVLRAYYSIPEDRLRSSVTYEKLR